MLIDNKNKSLQIKLGESVDSNELIWNVNYIDTIIPQAKDGITNGSSPITMVTGIPIVQRPPQNASRKIESLSVYNSDEVSHIVTISLINDSIDQTIVSVTLGISFTLHYEVDSGWYVTNENGAIVNVNISVSGISIGDTIIGSSGKKILYETAGNLLGESWIYQDDDKIKITDTKLFSSEDGNVVMDFGSGSSFNVSVESSQLYLDATTSKIDFDGDGLIVTGAESKISDSDQITLDSPIYNFSQLIPSTVPCLDSSKNLVSSSVTPVQLNYVSGVTSAIQTQLNGKEPSITPGTTLKYWRGDKSFQTLDTLIVAENTNLYFTNARAVSALSGLYELPLSFTTGLTRTANTITVNASQNIAKLSNLPTNGFVKTSSGDGTLLVDTSTYQPLDSDLTSWAAITRSSGFDAFTTTPSSASLLALITDETGTGSLVFAISPTFITPLLGMPTSGTLTNCTGLPLSSGITGVLAMANGGTGQNTAILAFNALAPTTTRGDIIAMGAVNDQRLALGAVGTFLRSDGTDISYSALTVPNTTSINTLLFSSSANTVSALATGNNGILTTSATGVPSISSQLTYTTSSGLLSNTLSMNGDTIINVINADATVSGAARSIIRTSNNTVGLSMISYGTNFLTSNLLVPSIQQLTTSGGPGMLISSTSSSTYIKFAIGGTAATNESGSFISTGLDFSQLLKTVSFSAATNKMGGQVTLVAGVATVTITGLTTSHKCLPCLQVPVGTIGTYKCACTANTLTITSIVMGSLLTQTLDTSTLNYFIFLTN